MIPSGHPPVQLCSRPSATYQVLLTKCLFKAIKLAITSETEKILDLFWIKILNCDSHCIFGIILVEKNCGL